MYAMEMPQCVAYQTQVEWVSAAVAGIVCDRFHMEATSCAKEIQWSAPCKAAPALEVSPAPS